MPITRAYLARYYDKYPLAPLPDAATDLAARLRTLSADLAAVAPITPGERLRPLSLIFTRDPLLSFPRRRIISISSPFFNCSNGGSASPARDVVGRLSICFYRRVALWNLVAIRELLARVAESSLRLLLDEA